MKPNLNAEINKETVRIFYEEYKDILFPILVIIVSIGLFFIILLPQVFALGIKKNDSNAQIQKLNDLKETQSLANNANQGELTSNLSLATSVLPSSKDFEAVLDSISSASSDSNVPIQSYSFQDSTTTGVDSLSNFPSLKFSIVLSGGAKQAMTFIDSLSQKAPISQVGDISTQDQTTTLTVDFFYKPFSPLGAGQDVKIKQLTPQQQGTLSLISGWDVSKSTNGTIIESSGSAQESSSPF